MIPRLRLFCAVALAAGSAVASLVPTRFPDDAGAHAAWTECGDAPPAHAADDGIRFDCPFNETTERFYWDCIQPIDLSGPASLHFDLTIDRPEAIRTLSIYFKSGSGWYHWSRPVTRGGRQTLSLAKAAFAPEDRPRGWDRVERLRISPWRGSAASSRITLHGLSLHQDRILVVQGTSSMPNPSEREASRQAAQRISQWLDGAGIAHGSVDDAAVADGALDQVRAAIFAYNSALPVVVSRAIDRFLDGNGKLIVFGSASEPLARRMGVRLEPESTSGRPGQWAALRFTDAAQPRLPEKVYNTAWTTQPAVPASSQAEIIATWEDSLGRVSQLPAALATPHGFWFTSILRSDDPIGKQRMLVGLLGDLVPEVLGPAARHAFASVGRIARFDSLPDALEEIRRGAPPERRDRVEARIAGVERSHQQVARLFAARRYLEAIDAAAATRRELVEAYGLIQPAPPAGELRAVWDHDGVGWYPGDWRRTCRELAAAGMTAIFPNLLWAGKAHTPSTVLPRSKSFAQFGDQAAQCLAAARAAGLQVHVWKVCWNLENAPPAFVDRMRLEGRLQRSARGSTRNWLCPSHRENVRLELAGIDEFLRAYPVDGLHLDYVRFPDAETCFCQTCRTAFETHLGHPLSQWPGEALAGDLADRWRIWRAQQITNYVRGVRDTLHAALPNARLSAAVYRQYPSCRDSIGQDWAGWIQQDLVDFVCPMNYTVSATAFELETARQFSLTKARGRIVPGIGVSASESQLTADQVIDQIQAARRLSAPGFILFDLSPSLRDEVLPILRLSHTPTER